MLHDFGRRFTGSADLYADEGRPPAASINLVTAHDGFTLADLVSYDRKHNRANGDGNRDGESHNRSWNCGVEGPTDDPAILALRTRQRRNLLATLLLSQGVPMLLGGDELGRTQHGNNNGYCHDSELSWYDWEAVDADMLDFTRRLIALRRAHPVFTRRHWFRWACPTTRSPTRRATSSGASSTGRACGTTSGTSRAPAPSPCSSRAQHLRRPPRPAGRRTIPSTSPSTPPPRPLTVRLPAGLARRSLDLRLRHRRGAPLRGPRGQRSCARPSGHAVAHSLVLARRIDAAEPHRP